ncbi:MAG: DMT family transporter [Candidatus Hodarchaeales archaeon]
MKFSKEYIGSVITALFVTLLWSSSWVIIKYGLIELPPLLFAGLRYTFASFILIVAILSSKKQRKLLIKNKREWWTRIIIYGLVFIAFTQGMQFIALSVLPAITTSFVLNLTPYFVIFYSVLFLNEFPSFFDLFFFALAFLGVCIYFVPSGSIVFSIINLFIAFLLVNINAISSILGRAINRVAKNTPLLVTGTSMSIGSIFLLLSSILVEEIPEISFESLFLIIWLAVVNTALAFTLWNKAMKHIRAMDMSLINSLMLPQIVFLSIIFLEEIPTINEWVGLIIVLVSTLVIQISQSRYHV